MPIGLAPGRPAILSCRPKSRDVSVGKLPPVRSRRLWAFACQDSFCRWGTCRVRVYAPRGASDRPSRLAGRSSRAVMRFGHRRSCSRAQHRCRRRTRRRAMRPQQPCMRLFSCRFQVRWNEPDARPTIQRQEEKGERRLPAISVRGSARRGPCPDRRPG